MNYKYKKNIDCITLPNGQPLRFGMSFQNKSPRDYSYSSIKFILNQIDKSTTKITLPKLALRSKFGQVHIYTLDFDKLPDTHGDWDSFYTYIKQNIKSNGVVCRTPSNKVKVLFLVNEPFGINFKDRDFTRESFVKEVLGEYYLSFLDKNAPDSHCFVTKSMLFSLQELNNTKLHSIRFSKTTGFKNFKLYKGQIPDFIRFWVKDSQVREEFIRFLMCIENFNEGFDLPCKMIADICGCTPANVSLMIKDMIKLGLLELKDASYKIGIKAKTYKAVGELSKLNIKKERSKPDFKDGNWNKSAYILSLNPEFKINPDKYLNYAKSIPGVDIKNRIKHFEYIYKKLKKESYETCF